MHLQLVIRTMEAPHVQFRNGPKNFSQNFELQIICYARVIITIATPQKKQIASTSNSYVAYQYNLETLLMLFELYRPYAL